MKRFIFLTFCILAWAFWELSDGADFEPEVAARPDPGPLTVDNAPEPELTQAQPEPAPAAAPEPEPVEVAAEAPTSQPDPAPQPAPAPADATAAPSAAAPEPVVAETTPAETLTPAADPAPEAAPAADRDIRILDAERVNLRSGPSTDYRVLDTLGRDTRVEVVEIDLSGDEPWARLVVEATGLEGWMAERFLVRP